MAFANGTIIFYTDIACPWSTLALHRFYAERRRQGLEQAVTVDLRLFSLEVVNDEPVPKRTVDAEIAVVGTAAPDFGFAMWHADPATWPVTTLLANEAAHAAQLQSPRAGEQLDMALRQAFFRDSRCISLRHEILAVAEQCVAVDGDQLARDLDRGTARSTMMAQFHERSEQVKGSPHFFLSDGSDQHNPGIELHWQGEPESGFPVIDSDDPTVYADLVRRAAGR